MKPSIPIVEVGASESRLLEEHGFCVVVMPSSMAGSVGSRVFLVEKGCGSATRRSGWVGRIVDVDRWYTYTSTRVTVVLETEGRNDMPEKWFFNPDKIVLSPSGEIQPKPSGDAKPSSRPEKASRRWDLADGRVLFCSEYEDPDEFLVLYQVDIGDERHFVNDWITRPGGKVEFVPSKSRCLAAIKMVIHKLSGCIADDIFDWVGAQWQDSGGWEIRK